MEFIVKFFLSKIKCLIVISMLIILACILVCTPIAFSQIIEFILKTLGISLFFLLPLIIAKFNNFIGNTEVFTNYSATKNLFIYGFFNIVFLCLFGGLLGVLAAFMQRNLMKACLLIPSLIGGYTTAKSVRIYEEFIKETSKTH